MTPQITRLVIHGRVQGVGYRAWLAKRARHEGYSGWVRNRRDGTVEALIDAAPDSLVVFIAACREGPPASRIDHIEVTGLPREGETFIADDFTVRPTV
ncbi:acylphosphatase [Ancylobacter pratisalsi]|uniref:acylphosphatase n=1 Tax=Ancylobacter pratisalsi TaxID=1745854 RepID=A0A6P1YJC2_9HYPH|nr:acylphosphatase [Ancylobacter pratisalsi]QIB32343.1 acylphosphatase [Ancylobacter pratisalsi]